MAKTALQRLQEYRERHFDKASELAELLDLTEPHFSQIINGKRRPGLATAVRIEDVTGIAARSWVPKRVGRSKKRTPAESISAQVA